MQLPFLLRASTYGLVLVSLLCVEWLAPFAKSQQKKSFRVVFHLGLSIANSLILYVLIAFPTLALVGYTEAHSFGLAHFLGLHGPAEIPATVVVLDFWDYWMHLANHGIGFLWRFHKAHHSDMEVDVTTASRFHTGELLISGMFKCLMILLWGPSLWGLAIFEAMLTGASQFHHSNIAIPLRLQDAIETVIVTPRMHRCHHALHLDCAQSNFSAIFSGWDRVFRSYHWSRDPHELYPLGVRDLRGPATMRLKDFVLTPFL